ncbi:regulatory protein RecX [Erysipelotrichaceae bacterium]|nr:regulatory protein RecX [Erysipelotrichaceae bacterium]
MYTVIQITEQKDDRFLVDLEVGQNQVEQHIVKGSVLAELIILKPGVITEQQYKSLQDKTLFYEAYTKALHYLSFRKRSIKEMDEYLKIKKLYEQAVVSEVIDRLVEQEYLNDADFMAAYIQNSFIVSYKGPKKLTYELLRLGCQPHEIALSLEALYSEEKKGEQIERLYEKILKKKYVSENQLKKAFEEKAYELGYDSELIALQLEKLADEEYLRVDDSKMRSLIEREYQKLVRKKKKPYEIKMLLKNKLVAKKMSFSEADELVSTMLEILEADE